MSSKVVKTLGAFKKLTRFDKGLGAALPEAYKKFWNEWQLTEPAAVHYIPEEGHWKRDDITGHILPIQNIPIPLKFPQEHDEQMWGGEGVVQGFQKRDKFKRKVTHFWVPVLKRSVVYSEVLDKHISVILTNRALHLIDANYGFDHYLLKTAACNLKSLLPLSLKRKILQDLQQGCPAYSDRPEKQQEVYASYKQYLTSYTPEEIDWYGYSFEEACKKLKESVEAQNKPVLLKNLFRAQLIEALKNAQLEETTENGSLKLASKSSTTSWIKKNISLLLPPSLIYLQTFFCIYLRLLITLFFCYIFVKSKKAPPP